MSQSYYRLHMQTLSQQNLTSLIFLTESNRNKLWYPERIICFLIRFWRNLKKCTFCKPSASYLILWDSWLVKTTFSQWNGSFLIYILIPGSFSSHESFCLEIIFYDLNLLGSASQRVSESMDALFCFTELPRRISSCRDIYVQCNVLICWLVQGGLDDPETLWCSQMILVYFYENWPYKKAHGYPDYSVKINYIKNNVFS